MANPTGTELVPAFPMRPDGTPGAIELFFTSQQIANLSSATANPTLSVAGAVGNQQFGSNSVPASGYLLYVIFRETAGVTVDVGIGTAPGGTDVLAAQIVPGSETLTVAITGFSKNWFSATLPQTLYLSSASWGGASINAQLVYQVGP